MGLQVGRTSGLRGVVSFILILMVSMQGSYAAQQVVSIVYNDFTDLSKLQINQDAVTLNPSAEQTLKLTNTYWQSSSVFLTDRIYLNDKYSFSSKFSFRLRDLEIGDPNRNLQDKDGVKGADGIVFVVQTVSNTAGGQGGQIGYGGLRNSIGIEFDTWANDTGDDKGTPVADPANQGNHVGINFNGVMEASNHHVPIPTPLNNGEIWWAWVDYEVPKDQSKGHLQVYLSSSSLKPFSPTIEYWVDIAEILERSDAFVGFTSGTGDGANTHEILTWSFVNTFSDGDPTDLFDPECNIDFENEQVLRGTVTDDIFSEDLNGDNVQSPNEHDLNNNLIFDVNSGIANVTISNENNLTYDITPFAEGDLNVTFEADIVDHDAGDASALITATDVAGNSCSQKIAINGNVPPLAIAQTRIASYLDTENRQYLEIKSGETVILDGSHSTDPDGDFADLTFSWDLDDKDGVSSPDETGPEVELTLVNKGIHNITLTVTDSEGKSRTDSVIVRVVPVIADIEPPVCELKEVDKSTLAGLASDDIYTEDNNLNDIIDLDEGDFNDNNVFDINSGVKQIALDNKAVNLQLILPDDFVAGDLRTEFGITLIDTNASGAGNLLITDGFDNLCQVMATLGGNEAPTAIATANKMINPYTEDKEEIDVVAGEALQFDGSQSFDPDGEISYYYWGVDVKDNVMSTEHDESRFSYTFQEPGVHYVTLMVIDNGGLSAKDDVRVTVHPKTGDISAPMCLLENQVGYSVSGKASDLIYSEDVNENGVLDFNEPDSNANKLFDINSGIQWLQLSADAQNLTLDIESQFVSGNKEVGFVISMEDIEQPASGSLIAADGYGNQCKQMININANGVPVAHALVYEKPDSPEDFEKPRDAVSSITITQDKTLVLDGSGSSDDSGLLGRYMWTVEGKTIDAVTTEYQFSKSGNYDITFQVADNDGSLSEEKSIAVQVNPRVLDLYAPIATELDAALPHTIKFLLSDDIYADDDNNNHYQDIDETDGDNNEVFDINSGIASIELVYSQNILFANQEAVDDGLVNNPLEIDVLFALVDINKDGEGLLVITDNRGNQMELNLFLAKNSPSNIVLNVAGDKDGDLLVHLVKDDLLTVDASKTVDKDGNIENWEWTVYNRCGDIIYQSSDSGSRLNYQTKSEETLYVNLKVTDDKGGTTEVGKPNIYCDRNGQVVEIDSLPTQEDKDLPKIDVFGHSYRAGAGSLYILLISALALPLIRRYR